PSNHRHSERTTSPSRCPSVTASISVTAGNSATLENTITGSPELSVKWFKDGKEIISGHKYKVKLKEHSALLKILTSEQGDTGDYTMVVSNKVGQDKCTSSVTGFNNDIVLQEAESIGSSAVFECEVSPSTAITSWMKDGTNLRESPKHKFTSDGKDRKLNIIDVQLSDTGEYTCVAKNAGKEISSDYTIEVEDRKYTAKLTLGGRAHK
uniref:Ig-like domain-containing protein n=1 Tax=Oryzias latipes TaxID=8090 RepID=A0A3B3HXL7_ORYLA